MPTPPGCEGGTFKAGQPRHRDQRAALLPYRRPHPRPRFGATFGAEHLFRYPEPLGAAPTFADAARGFTFGVMRIDDAGRAAIDVVTALDDTVYTLALPRP